MAHITNDEVEVEVAVVGLGLGWAGSLMSIELAQADLKVRAFERGEDRTNVDFHYPNPADHYAYVVRNKIIVTPMDGALTVRHNLNGTALQSWKRSPRQEVRLSRSMAQKQFDAWV